jgi:hypothetical protein
MKPPARPTEQHEQSSSALADSAKIAMLTNLNRRNAEILDQLPPGGACPAGLRSSFAIAD